MSAVYHECHSSTHNASINPKEREVMKRVVLKWALLLVVLVLSMAPVAAWEQTAVVRNCTWCHGTSAQGYTVAPRLAGQRPLYLEGQIRSFREHIRDNPLSRQYMWGAAATVGPEAARDLAGYFASIEPKPANDGNSALAARGRAIYMEGIPEANIAACYACHGPNAEGIRDIPRLGGLGHYYLKARLEQWGQGYHSLPDSPMPLVARSLGPDVVEALTSYLSFVR